jgi:adenosylcobinamide-GDP ribazoletransferase
MISGLITAIRTLTVFPMPGKDAKQFCSALYFFPLVGALLGVVVGGAVVGLEHYAGWHSLGVVAGVAVLLLATGCLHLDGFADVCDSLGGSTMARRLEIMKDSRVGAYGVAGAVVYLIAKCVCLARMSGLHGMLAIIAVLAVSRAMQVVIIVALPYARKEGTAGPFVEGASVRHMVVAFVLAVGLAVGLLGCTGLVVVTASAVVTLCIGSWARGKFGGVTGDVVGFTNELVELAGLIVVGIMLG